MNTKALYVVNKFNAKPQYDCTDNERRIHENYTNSWVYVDPRYYTDKRKALIKNMMFIYRYFGKKSLNGQVKTTPNYNCD